MPITRRDIITKVFTSANGGYDAEEVDAFLDLIADSLDLRDDALRTERRRTALLTGELRRLDAQLADLRHAASQAENADAEAKELLEQAKLQARMVVNAAREEAGSIVKEAAEKAELQAKEAAGAARERAEDAARETAEKAEAEAQAVIDTARQEAKNIIREATEQAELIIQKTAERAARSAALSERIAGYALRPSDSAGKGISNGSCEDVHMDNQAAETGAGNAAAEKAREKALQPEERSDEENGARGERGECAPEPVLTEPAPDGPGMEGEAASFRNYRSRRAFEEPAKRLDATAPEVPGRTASFPDLHSVPSKAGYGGMKNAEDLFDEDGPEQVFPESFPRAARPGEYHPHLEIRRPPRPEDVLDDSEVLYPATDWLKNPDSRYDK